MGRAWRNGQTDVAIGAAGLTVLHGYAGAHDAHGNELMVTEIASPTRSPPPPIW